MTLAALWVLPVALVGSMRRISGERSLLTFFLFPLAVSRICEPMSFSLQNLAAMNSLQVNIDRMNEINESPSQSGGIHKSNSDLFPSIPGSDFERTGSG